MATANNKRIEESAVNAVKAALLRCPILDAYIDENDKTPSWDGTVFAYKNGEQKKCDLLGRVPVQVKAPAVRDGLHEDDLAVEARLLIHHVHEIIHERAKEVPLAKLQHSFRGGLQEIAVVILLFQSFIT